MADGKDDNAQAAAATTAADGSANADMDVDAPASASMSHVLVQPESVVVHPLVLLSVVDHYNREAKDTNKRVVGILLGSWKGKQVDVANSYASPKCDIRPARVGILERCCFVFVAGCDGWHPPVPFEEDEADPSIWFLDHNYHENMWEMFRKVNAKEKVVGWYHSGPRLRVSDLAINDVIKRYTANPVLVIVDVQPKELGLPTDAYFAVQEIKDDGTQTTKTFAHIPTEVRAEEAEEIGVEHLLRDIKDNAATTLATRVSNQISALRGLQTRLQDVHAYLEKVAAGELPINQEIVQNMQDIFNLLPNLNVGSLVTAFAVNSNDQLMVIYLASLIRSILALHNLVNNKRCVFRFETLQRPLPQLTAGYVLAAPIDWRGLKEDDDAGLFVLGSAAQISNREAEREADGDKNKDKDKDKDAKDKEKETGNAAGASTEKSDEKASAVDDKSSGKKKK